MKNHLLSFATCVAAIMFASCSKEDTQQPNLSQETTIEVSITAELDEFAPTTKATAEACIRLKWEGGETVYAYSELSDGTLSGPATLTASISDNAYVAVLKGTITAPTDADKTLYLVYSPSGAPSISNHTLTVSMNETQASDKVPFVAYAKLTGVTATDYQTDGLQAKFSFASSVINVNVTGLGSGVSLSSASMTGLAPNCTITLGSTIEVGKSGDETTYTKRLSGSATTGGKAQFFLAVPEMAASSSRVLTVTDVNEIRYTESGVVAGAHSANSYVNTICCMEKESLLLSGKFSVSDTTKVKFTRGNLYWDGSAFKIEENQTDYPANWSTSHVSHLFWTKTAEASYAASYNDGTNATSDIPFLAESKGGLSVDGQSGLYALSSEEWNYLINRCNSKLCEYGVTVSNGGTNYTNCLIIAPDDFTGTQEASYTLDQVNALGLVCFPAAGLRIGSNLFRAGSYGFYWSATPYEGSEDIAYGLGFGDNYVAPSSYSTRSSGGSVRLVCSVPK